MTKTKQDWFYAVKEGRTTGVFLTWEECNAQIKGYSGAKHKKFTNAAEAEAFVSGKLPSSTSLTKDEDSFSDNTVRGTKGKKRSISTCIEDESGWDVVYSDGACKGNGKRGSVAGIGVWWGVDDPRNIAERCPGDQTNNRAELIAIIRVLESTPKTSKPLLIKTDSQYSINCFESWLPKWQCNDFKTSAGTPVKNIRVIRYLSALLAERAQYGQKVRLQYVKGHSGEPGNDGADHQANIGTTMPAIPEEDWETLEKRLAQWTEDKSKKSSDIPMNILPEIRGSAHPGPSESPLKIRKVSPESPLSAAVVASRGTTPALTSDLHLVHQTGSSRKVPVTPPAAFIPPTMSSEPSSHLHSVRAPELQLPRLKTSPTQISLSPQKSPNIPEVRSFTSPQRRHGAGVFPRVLIASPTQASTNGKSPKPLSARDAVLTDLMPDIPLPEKHKKFGSFPQVLTKEQINWEDYEGCALPDDELEQDLSDNET